MCIYNISKCAQIPNKQSEQYCHKHLHVLVSNIISDAFTVVCYFLAFLACYLTTVVRCLLLGAWHLATIIYVCKNIDFGA